MTVLAIVAVIDKGTLLLRFPHTRALLDRLLRLQLFCVYFTYINIGASYYFHNVSISVLSLRSPVQPAAISQ